MPDLAEITDGLAAVRKLVDTAAKATAKTAAADQKKRDAAIEAAEAAGLVVDVSALPDNSATFASQRYATLAALLTDSQNQLDQIESLTG